MNDHELLELAAKAAGVGGKVRAIQKLYSHDYEIGVGKYRWNPLTDDGDALRLAVKLGMDIFGDEDYRYAEGTRPRSLVQEPCGDDPYAATRRAIVRAAAEIGKEMK